MKTTRYGLYYRSNGKTTLHPAFFAINGVYEPVFRETNNHASTHFTYGTL